MAEAEFDDAVGGGLRLGGASDVSGVRAMASIGTPAASASMVEFMPVWVTKASAWASTAHTAP